MLDNLQLLFVWAPIINVQVILEGIFVGAVFALSAYGLALVWGVMNIKNLAEFQPHTNLGGRDRDGDMD